MRASTRTSRLGLPPRFAGKLADQDVRGRVRRRGSLRRGRRGGLRDRLLDQLDQFRHFFPDCFRRRGLDRRHSRRVRAGTGRAPAVRVAGGLFLRCAQMPALRLLDQVLLRIEQHRLAVARLPWRRTRAACSGGRTRSSRSFAVSAMQVSRYPSTCARKSSLEHRPGYLDALVHVARHEVGARQVHLHVVARAEPVDAAVFQQAPDDGHHAHAFGASFHARHDAADARARAASPARRPARPLPASR